MFKEISKSKGFYKVEKDGVKYNFSTKKFDDLKSQELIEESTVEEVVIVPIESDKQDLSTLKKTDLVEIAQRLGFAGEITNAVTKAILIEFINKN
jgi:hypothetical protein